MKRNSALGMGAVLLFAAFAAIGCGKGKEGGSTAGGDTAVKGTVEGKILIDGSSTVFPISQAVAEEFMKENKGVNIAVAESGTGGGFKKFANGEIDIAGASRPISEEEIAACKEKGIEFIELPIAFDGLSVVVNPKNTWVESLTVEELKNIWKPDSTVKKWSDVRAGLPDREIKLYGAGADSGTFEYFTEAIVGKKKASRADYNQSEDDNILVQGVAGDENALGYFGLSYYLENTDKLKLLKIDDGSGPVAPSVATVNNGTYKPLSRPIFIYVTKKAIERPEVLAFVKYYVGSHGQALVEEVGYVKLPEQAYKLAMGRVDSKTVGTVFTGKNTIGIKIEDLLAQESK